MTPDWKNRNMTHDELERDTPSAPEFTQSGHRVKDWDVPPEERSDCGGYAGGKAFTGITPPRSDTPLTDIRAFRKGDVYFPQTKTGTLYISSDTEFVEADFARSLERQRDAAVEEVEMAKEREDGLRAGIKDLADLVGVGDEPRFKWIRLEISHLKQRAEQAATENERMSMIRLALLLLAIVENESTQYSVRVSYGF